MFKTLLIITLLSVPSASVETQSGLAGETSSIYKEQLEQDADLKTSTNPGFLFQPGSQTGGAKLLNSNKSVEIFDAVCAFEGHCEAACFFSQGSWCSFFNCVTQVKSSYLC